jgi:cytochrome c oxidase cbb3-type subunit III
MSEQVTQNNQADVDTGHDYDGIHEFDNPLPRWWLIIFYGTVLFGYGYWMHLHVAKTGTTIASELAAEQAEIAKKNAASKPLTDDVLVALSKDQTTVEAGAKVFSTTCVACHGEKAEGKIGPNLTDEYWLHGGKPTDIHRSVAGGWVEKGMPSWQPVLGAERVRQVVAFVLTKRGLNLPGKERQGEPYSGK